MCFDTWIIGVFEGNYKEYWKWLMLDLAKYSETEANRYASLKDLYKKWRS